MQEVSKWPDRLEEVQRGWGLQALEERALRRSEKKGVHGDPALSSHLAASQSRTPHHLPPGLRVSGPVGAEAKALPNCLQRRPHWGPLSRASGPALAGDRFLSGDFALGVSLRD